MILRQALTDLLTPLLADHAVCPAGDNARHQHSHLHGLTADHTAAILTALDARHHVAPGQDGGSQ